MLGRRNMAARWRIGFASLLLLVAGWGLADESNPQAVIDAIKSHFKSVTPELNRYGGLTLYGETLSTTAISKEALAREIALYQDAAAAGLLKSPSDEVLSLGHNLIIHDPGTGASYLKLLHISADLADERHRNALYAATLAAGEKGEEMAVGEMASKNKDRRDFWASYLSQNALYLSSEKPILKYLADEPEPSIKVRLIWALSMIGDPGCLAEIKSVVEHATADEVQAAAIFTYAELAGLDGIGYLESVKPIGAKSTKEKDGSVAWLKKETRADLKHGREVSSDPEFAGLYGDLHTSPVMRWLNTEGLLAPGALKDPPTLAPAKKKELLALLIDSKGFGLEAVKGALFGSLSKEDEPLLLQIRAVSFYSPSYWSNGRLKTIGIMVRKLRQEP
jgi:hypothetical protein